MDTRDDSETDQKFILTPDGQLVTGPGDDSGRRKPDRDQPSPVKPDGQLRNMVDPYTGDDSGGNPLEEGVWSTATGTSWKPWGKRDEIDASVKTSVSYPYEQYDQGGWAGTRDQEAARHYKDAEDVYKNHGWDSAHKFLKPLLEKHHEQYSAPHGTDSLVEPDMKSFGQDMLDAHGGDAPSMWEERHDKKNPANLNEEGHQLNWTPGMRGRGVFIGPDFHTWNAWDPEKGFDPKTQGPGHAEYLQNHGVKPGSDAMKSAVEIHPDGGIENVTGSDTSPHTRVDERLHEMSPDQGFTLGKVSSTRVAPRSGGIHVGPLSFLKNLNGLHINGSPVQGSEEEVLNRYGKPESPEFEKPVDVWSHNPDIESLATRVIKDGHGIKDVYTDHMNSIAAKQQSGESPTYAQWLEQGGVPPSGQAPPPTEEARMAKTDLNFNYDVDYDAGVYNQPYFNRHGSVADTGLSMEPYMPWGYEDPNLDRVPRHVPTQTKSSGFIAPLVEGAGALLTNVVPKIMGSALAHGAVSALGGGGGGGGGAGGGTPDASYYSALETPTTNPRFVEALDGDTKQFDSETTSPRLDNPTINGEIGGMDQGEDETHQEEKLERLFGDDSPGIERMKMMLPLVLHYMNSEDSGMEDPTMRSLHEMLDKESPGYLEKGDDKEFDKFLKALKEPDQKVHHNKKGAMPTPNQDPLSLQQGAPPTGTSTPPIPPQGGVVPGTAGMAPDQPQAIPDPTMAQDPQMMGQDPSMMDPQMMGADGPPLTPEEIAMMQQQGVQANRTAADHQGPVTREQQVAVAELLSEQGRHNEIVDMIEAPWDYSEELSEVAQQQPPPPNVDPEEPAAPPPPAQEEAPPGDTMPVPNPADPSQQPTASVTSADNVAPRCPNCGSATTGVRMDDQNTTFECHACGNVWGDDTKADLDKPQAKVARPEDDMREDSDHHEHPDIREPQEDDNEDQDSSDTWQDEQGQPLQIGDEYEMHSTGYTIPDIVRVDQVKPDSITVSTISDYSQEAGGNDMAYSHEVSKEEANIEGLRFVHHNGDDDSEPSQPEAEPSSQVNTEPVQEPDLDRRPTGNSKLAWLQDENFDGGFGERASSNYSKVAGQKFTPIEQREFIEEKGMARNSDKMDLSGTHYESHVDDLDDEMLWI